MFTASLCFWQQTVVSNDTVRSGMLTPMSSAAAARWELNSWAVGILSACSRAHRSKATSATRSPARTSRGMKMVGVLCGERRPVVGWEPTHHPPSRLFHRLRCKKTGFSLPSPTLPTTDSGVLGQPLLADRAKEGRPPAGGTSGRGRPTVQASL